MGRKSKPRLWSKIDPGHYLVFPVLLIICISFFTASIILFLTRTTIGLGLPCPSCTDTDISFRIGFPQNKIVEVINTTQAFIDKFNRSPKIFSYKKVEVEPQAKKALGEMFPLQEIATFEITKDYYVTIFLTEDPNYYLEVSWNLSEGKINILDKKTQEGIPILKTTYSKAYNYTMEGNEVYYVVKGEATYYEIPIQINSIIRVEETIYHTYDWTTTYVYMGNPSNLIYEVTAAGDFYWIYGVEIWVYPYATHTTYYGWMRCSLNKQAYNQYTKACYVEAKGKASVLYAPFIYWYLNVVAVAQVGHDCWGGDNHWGTVESVYYSFGPCG